MALYKCFIIIIIIIIININLKPQVILPFAARCAIIVKSFWHI